MRSEPLGQRIGNLFVPAFASVRGDPFEQFGGEICRFRQPQEIGAQLPALGREMLFPFDSGPPEFP